MSVSGAGAYRGVRALVLGATGFVGRRVVLALARAGAHVIAMARDADALATALEQMPGTVESAVCDARRWEDLAHVVAACRPAVMFNLAGYGVDPAERDEATARALNAELPALLVELLRTERQTGWAGQALLHAGSALEYGVATGNLNELTTPLPDTLYGTTKLAGTLGVEDRARRHRVPAITARLFTVYGPGEHAGRLLPALLETSRTGVPLPLTAGTQRRDFTFVDDVADALLRLACVRPQYGLAVNVATGRLTTVRSFAERAARVLGIDATLLRFGAVPMRAEEMAHDPVSVELLRRLTGRVPTTTIEDGVACTFAALSGHAGEVHGQDGGVIPWG